MRSEIVNMLLGRTYSHLLWGAFLCVFGTKAFGTSVVAIWTHDSIAIAVDSRHQLTTTKGATKQVEMCKIHIVGNLIAVMSGMYAYVPSHFDAIGALNAALLKGHSVREVVDMMDQSIIPAYRRALRDKAQRFPKSKFPHLYSPGAAKLQYLVAEIVFPGQSVVAYRELTPDQEPVRHYDETQANQVGFATFGFNEISSAYFQNNPQWYWGAITDDIAKRLVEQEAAANPIDVGGPITVVVFDSNSRRWIQQGSCQ